MYGRRTSWEWVVLCANRPRNLTIRAGLWEEVQTPEKSGGGSQSVSDRTEQGLSISRPVVQSVTEWTTGREMGEQEEASAKPGISSITFNMIYRLCTASDITDCSHTFPNFIPSTRYSVLHLVGSCMADWRWRIEQTLPIAARSAGRTAAITLIIPAKIHWIISFCSAFNECSNL